MVTITIGFAKYRMIAELKTSERANHKELNRMDERERESERRRERKKERDGQSIG